MPRPRRAAAPAAKEALRSTEDEQQDPNMDPEFLALSAKQRRRIDRAFSRGIQIVEGRSNKRRKIEKKLPDQQRQQRSNGQQEEGGFLPDESNAGGFMDEDIDAGGGFLPDDEGDAGGGFMLDDDDDEGGGGFLPDDQDNEEGGFVTSDQAKSRSASVPIPGPPTDKRIPLHLLPSLLSSLGLPSDEDVLAVFKASASGWEDEDQSTNTSRKKRGLGEDENDNNAGGVELKDFRAVCAALMGPDENGDTDQAGDEDDDEGLEEEDTFELPSDNDESDLSSLSGSEYGTEETDNHNKSGRSTRVNRIKSRDFAESGSSTPNKRKIVTRGKKKLDLDSTGKIRLNSRQKELAKDIWDMLKPSNSQQQKKSGTKGDSSSSYVLGRDEVKKWVRELGEMWNDEEITEMVTLFSSQHEGRGLTFEDFGGVMLRAGLV
ncbi:uncharacterized protein L201_001658 [Kwoniella dendrophila CBS 6074]|uniref:EF-hand domain-containing protein n=1 Tax=Kwoniella dendrophila CBS 6074 TaxID=1295534 RepID=A0AAX4JPG0_9TREE